MAEKTKSIVIIDAGVDAPLQLAAGIILEAEVLVLSRDEDGIEQITAVLELHPNITNVYLVAHGFPGGLLLGNSELSLVTLEHYQNQLRQWFIHGSSPNLYLYGCQVAAGDAGAAFLAQLRSLTGASIAASTRFMGQAERGGSWHLDTQLGNVPPRSLLSPEAIASYAGVLAPPANDNFNAATKFTAPGTLTGTTVDATNEAGEPIHDPTVVNLTPAFQALANDSAWWQWTAPLSGPVNVNTAGSGFNTVLAVYTGTSVGALSLVGKNDDVATGVTSSSITFNASAGTTYYFAVDGVGESKGAVTITVDTPPSIKSGQLFTVQEGVAAATVVGKVELEVPETNLTWTIVSGNVDNDGDGKGAFAIANDGTITVQDSGDLDFETFNQLYSLQVKTTDKGGFTDTETVFVEVTDKADPPVLISLSSPGSTNEGTVITLSGQLFDPDQNDAQTVTIAWGDGTTTIINSDDLVVKDGAGNKTFASNHTYNDDDGTPFQIQITIKDSANNTITSTRSISVTNVAPTITQGDTLTLKVSEDSKTTFQLSATDPSALDVLTYKVISTPTNGVLTPNPPGVPTGPADRSRLFTYTPNVNFSGTDTFQVQVQDDDGGTDTVTVNVEVAAQPDAPSALNLTATPDTLNEGESLTLTGSFVDPDVGDTFTVTINWGDGTAATVLTSKELIFNAATKTYSFASNHQYLEDSATTISVSVKDSFGAVASSSETITINNVAPVILPGNTSIQINEDTVGTVTLEAVDDADDIFTWQILTAAKNGTAKISSVDGAIQKITYTPNANYSGLDEFVVKVTDDDGGSNTATIVVGVDPVNDAPANLAIAVTPTTPINEGKEVTLSGSFQDVDNTIETVLDDIHTLTVNWGDGTIETFPDIALTGTTTATVAFAGLKHTYADEGTGSFTVTVTAKDKAGASVTTTQNVSVLNVAPIITDPDGKDDGKTTASVDEDGSLSVTLTATDPGVQDILAWSVIDPADNGSITFSPATVNGTQAFTYKPNLDFAGTDTFVIQVTDKDGGFDSLEYTVTVTGKNDPPQIVVNQFNVVEGESLLVDLGVLDAIDVEATTDDKIVFTITGAAATSFLVNGAASTTFTRQDLIDGVVTFLYNNETPPTFSIKVADDQGLSASQTGNIVSFETVNDAPVLTLTTPFVITEGGTVLIRSNNISATDEETGAAGLKFTVADVLGGTFLVNGVNSNVFTQEQINSNLVQFKHNGTETVPSYTITVSDGELTDTDKGTGTLNVVNDRPILLANQFTVTEGVELRVDAGVLDAQDAETVDNTKILFTVTGTDAGSFRLDGTTATTFNRQDIFDGRVTFLYDGETTPSFTITVSDDAAPNPGITSEAGKVAFTAVNDAPVLTLTNFTVSEGGTVLITAANISTVDPDSPAATLKYEVTDLAGGTFLVNNVVSKTFTQQQLTQNQVRFQHDGSETLPSYTITVSDGSLTDTEVGGGNLTKTNDLPNFLANQFTLTEGEVLLVDTGVLDAEDSETLDNTKILFTVTGTNANSFLVDGKADTTFTRQDIFDGRVTFLYDGETTPSFTIKVEDADGGSRTQTGQVTFTAVNDAPVLTLSNFTVSEGGTTLITTANIKATDVDSNTSALKFTVSDVAGGKFLVNGVDSTSFTQQQLAQNQVRFQQDGTETVPGYTITVSDGSLTDTEVGAGNLTLTNDLPNILSNQFTIVEGQPLLVNTSVLDAEDAETVDNSKIIFTITGTSATSFLVDGTPDATFTRQDIFDGRVTFLYEGETTPSFSIKVEDADGGSRTQTGQVAFTALNDAPVLTLSNFTVSEGGTALVSTSNIKATDVDSSTSALKFAASNVVGGKFLVNGVASTSFTQQQLAQNQVRFQHDGTETVPGYTITVSDGELTDTEVGTANLTTANDLPVITANQFTIKEGVAFKVDTGVLDATDEETTDDTKILFTISGTSASSFFVDGLKDNTFTRQELLENRVTFLYEGETAPSFTIKVEDGTGGSFSQAGKITFTAVNDFPTFVDPLTPFTVTEGGTVTLSKNNINAIDPDTSTTSLTFAVTNLQGGSFLVNNLVETSFTLQQINQNLVRFKQDGSNTVPSYTLTVSDGTTSATQDFTGILNAVNDVPVVQVNQITLSEGEEVILGDKNLLAIDEVGESTPAELIYTVTTVTKGQFEVGGVKVDNFSQAEVSQGLVTFVHDGSSTAPTYVLSLQDTPLTKGGTINTLANLSGTINFTAKNDLPELTINFPTVQEAGTVKIDSTVFNGIDEESGAAQLVYKVNQATNGTFQVSGKNAATFTQQDVASNLVTFVHNGSEAGPSFTITLSDSASPTPGTVTQTITPNFENQNDLPQLINNKLSLTEGQTITLTTNNLSASDVETDVLDLKFSITNIKSGIFKIDGLDYIEGDTFELLDVIQGKVVFIHDGLNTPPSYEVTVLDTDGGASAPPAPAQIDFVAVNDAPVLTIPNDDPVNSPPFVVLEGGIVSLDETNLNADDEDTPRDKLLYTVTNVVGGFFASVTDTKVAIPQFSQATVDARGIVFVHNGSNSAPSYTLKVDDGAGGIDTKNYIAGLTPLNDQPTITVNKLTLTEGDKVTLTINNLQAQDEESGPSDLTFEIKALSGNGQFFLGNTALGTGDTFTQQDVLNKLVSFAHNPDSNDPPSYTLAVQDNGVDGVDRRFSDDSKAVVTFTAVNDTPVVVKSEPFAIQQGETVPINEGILLVTDEESANQELLVYTVDTVNNGTFLLNGAAVATFTQKDIALGRLSFVQNGSELAPSFTVTVTDNGVPAPQTVTFSVDLKDTFQNINDAPTLINNTLTIAEGSTVLLNTSILSAKDAESSSLDLLFNIDKIDNGFFTIKGGSTFGEGQASTNGSFSLRDVVEQRVSFTHDGLNLPPAYTVSVTDTGTKTDPSRTSDPVNAVIVFKAVNDNPTLTVPNVDPANPTVFLPPFTINEGQTRALDTKNLDAQDEAGETPQNQLQFTVSTVLGGFFARSTATETAITTFTRQDVAQGEVVFVHNGSNTPPTYTLTVTDANGGSTSAKYVADLVSENDLPTFTVNKLALTEGDTVILTIKDLAANDEESGPANLTYTIESLSANGQFFVDGKAITKGGTFTQEQVQGGQVSFKHDASSNVAPAYSLLLNDGEVNGVTNRIGPVAADITFTVINDVPELTLTFPLVKEGAFIPITKDIIAAQDEESAPSQLIYKVDAIANAKFTLGGSETKTFSQQDILENKVTFIHDDSETAPTFTLTLSDNGSPTPNTLTVKVTPDFELQNRAPQFTANKLSPTEGQTIILTAADLAATDEEDVVSQLVFKIDPATVVGGEFFLDGKSLGTSTFTRADINFGRITFKDDGDEIAPAYSVTVTDTDGASTTEAATITPIKVNDNPTIEANTFAINEGGLLILKDTNLLAKDAETLDPAQLTYTITNLKAGQFFLDSNPTTPIATFTQKNINTGQVVFIQDKSSTPPSFTITVKDPNGGTTAVDAAVTFTGVNDAPSAVDDKGSGFSTDEDTAFTTLELTLNDQDEEGDALKVTQLVGKDVAPGDKVTINGAIVTLNADAKTLTYDPNKAFESLAVGETLNQSFEYTVSDGKGGTDTGTVTIVVNGVNDQPVANDDAGSGFATTEEAKITTPNLLKNDTDVDKNDILTISSIDTTGVRGQVTNNGNGTLIYNPVGFLNDLAQGEQLTEVVTYTLSDGKGGTDQATVTFVVTGINNLPVAEDDSGTDYVTTEDTVLVTKNVLANDKDADKSDILVVTAIDLTNTKGTVVDKGDGTFSYDPAGKFAALTPGQIATDTFGYTVSDGKGGTDKAVVTITINGVNNLPIATDDNAPGFFTNEDTFGILNVLANDTDADGAGQLTIASIDSTGVQGKLTNNGNSITYDPVGVLDKLQGGQVLEEVFSYTVKDAFGGTDTAQVKVIVNGANDSPIAVKDGGVGFTTNEETAFTTANVLTNDTDVDGPTLTLASIDTTGTKGIVINNGDGTFGYNPNGQFNLLGPGVIGQDTFSYTVSDGAGGQSNTTVTIDIVGLVEVPNSFFDYEQFLRYHNSGAVIPADTFNAIPLAQLFDENFYLSQNPDVVLNIQANRIPSGYAHFVNFGLAEGRSPSILFDEAVYLANNPDIAAQVASKNVSSGLVHFLSAGHIEGRNPSNFFNQQDYLTNNQDVAAVINPNGVVRSAFEHYINTGAEENRLPSLALFNEAFYLQNSPDIAGSIPGQFADGFAHFVASGQREGRTPSSLFNEATYLALNPDVAAAVQGGGFISGFQHYESAGRFEGRGVF